MRLFIIPIFLVAAASWAFFGYIVWAVPPKMDETLVISNLIYFLASGSLALGFTSGLVLYFIGSIFLPEVRGAETAKAPKKLLFRSFRRGLFFSVLISSVVALNIFGLLNILNAALVIGIILLAEIYFSGR